MTLKVNRMRDIRSVVESWVPASLALIAIVLAVLPATASAEYYDKLGYSAEDVERYHAMSRDIGPCRSALALDTHDSKHADLKKARTLATLYGQCRKALQARHAPIAVIRVNETMLGLQCFVIGGAGGTVESVPACTLPPLPDPPQKRERGEPHPTGHV